MSIYSPRTMPVEFSRAEALSNTQENLAPFKFSQFYINNSDIDVIIILRNNIPIRSIAGSSGYKKANEIIIRNVYSFQNINIINDTLNNLSQTMKTYAGDSKELSEIRDILLNKSATASGLHRFSGSCDITIDRTVRIPELVSKETVYIPESDIVLCAKSLNVACPHPFSNEGSTLASYSSLINQIRTSASVNIDIVDNENNISKRYLYVAKKVIELETLKDPTRTSGIYVTNVAHGLGRQPIVNTKFHELENAQSELGIFPTIEEAETGGDPNKIQAAKVAELQKELEISKYHRELSILENKTKLDAANNELENFKAQNARLREEAEIRKMQRDEALREREEAMKYRSMNRDDYYEERSHRRKESLEMLKYIPAFIIGAAAAYTATQSSSTKKG